MASPAGKQRKVDIGQLNGLLAKSANANPAFSKEAILACSVEIARFSLKMWPLVEADLAE